MLIISSDTQPVYAEHRKVWSSYMNSNSQIECYFIQYRDGPQEIEGNTFWLNGVESFPAILTKTLDSLEYFLKNKYDFIVRTNLSSVWNFPVLLNYLASLSNEKIYNGIIETYDNRIKYLSGAGFIMSYDVAKLLIENRNLAEECKIIDDVDIGYALNKLDIHTSSGVRTNFFSPASVSFDKPAYHYRFEFSNFSRLDEPSYMTALLNNFLIKPISITHGNGRFCNQLIRCIATSLVAKKHNLKIIYSIPDELSAFGLELFSGNLLWESIIELTDTNYFEILNSDKIETNLDPNKSFFQTREIIQTVYNFIQSNQESIISSNRFKDHYNNNNDCFVHIRLSDASQWNPGFEYYDKIIGNLKYDTLYISTDQSDHPLVSEIMSKYPTTLIQYNEVDTIKFASTCKYIVLSHGTFSSCIGYFSFFSEVYYPEFWFLKRWCGDIFSIPGWHRIGYSPFKIQDIICGDKFYNSFPDNYYHSDCIVFNKTINWRGKVLNPPAKGQDIIVTGHSDYGITNELVQYFTPKIWWTINKQTSDPTVHSLPLGITNNTNESDLHSIYGNLDSMIDVMNETKDDKNLVYMNFNVHTHPERNEVFRLFQDKEWVTKGIIENTMDGRCRFLREIRNHTFVLCPRGNGVDTHRLWETLYMGSIPIVKRDIVNGDFQDLPICFIDEWNEVNIEFLEKEKARIYSHQWSLDKLKVSYWINKMFKQR